MVSKTRPEEIVVRNSSEVHTGGRAVNMVEPHVCRTKDAHIKTDYQIKSVQEGVQKIALPDSNTAYLYTSKKFSDTVVVDVRDGDSLYEIQDYNNAIRDNRNFVVSQIDIITFTTEASVT